MIVENNAIKQLALSLGADICGVASVDRFSEAPKGYHPLDVFPVCKSVISFGCRFPVGALLCETHVPYTRIRNSISAKVDAIALDLCQKLEETGVMSVPIPAIEDQYDVNTGRQRSIVSLKHIAQAAGLGTIGRHSLLITPEFGSMLWLGAVLCDAEIEPDALKPSMCTSCNLCVNICPANALRGAELDQYACWEHAFGNDEEKKIWQISCHKCRDICPYNLGSKNSLIK